MIKNTFGDKSMSEAKIKLWYRRLKDGRESVESDRRSGMQTQAKQPKMLKAFGLN
jgi:hypothetical protein